MHLKRISGHKSNTRTTCKYFVFQCKLILAFCFDQNLWPKKKKIPNNKYPSQSKIRNKSKKKNIHQNFLKNNPLKFPEMKDNFRNWTNRVWFFVQSQSIRWFNWKQPKFLSKISIDNSKRKHFKPFDFFQFKNPIFYVKFLF